MTTADSTPVAGPQRPRRYRLGQRESSVADTRARIIAAARALLLASANFSGFSVDAVARKAGVARMTVYYQFGSKRGLLEALFDDLTARGGMRRMGLVHALADPQEALAELVAVFGVFWGTDRVIMRRVRGLAALDRELEQAVRTRDEWRRTHCRTILTRLAAQTGQPPPDSFEEAVDVLNTLISFETFDTLAGGTRAPTDVTPVVQRLTRAAIGLNKR